jgi:hypothetical protein
MQEARDICGYRKHWAARFGTAPFLTMSREAMDILGWDSCDVTPSGMHTSITELRYGDRRAVLEAQGSASASSRSPTGTALRIAALGRPNLFFGITAGNMDSR